MILLDREKMGMWGVICLYRYDFEEFLDWLLVRIIQMR
jgi:hypothetical protein